jgi:hypothetical protein
MKKLLCFIVLFFLALITIPSQLHAQAADTVTITALPAGNINSIINSDTLTGGVRAHPNRVYRLRHGSVYQVTEPMKIIGSITIIANDTTAGLRPPALAPAILSDNSSIDHFFDLNGKGSTVKISNLYLLSIRSDQNQLGWSDGIRIGADSVNMKFKGCIFDGFTEGGILLHGSWCKLDVQDCEFRNLQHASSYFGGQPFMTDNNLPIDTCKFINNTFFCNNSYTWSIRGFDRYALFEHNTVVYGTVNPFLFWRAYNLHLNNNLFYDVHAYGGVPEDVINSAFLNYPDTASSGIIMFRSYDTLSYWYKLWGSVTLNGVNVTAVNGVTADMVNPANRVIEVKNNSYFWPPSLTDFYKAYNDTVKTQDSTDVPNFTSNEGIEVRVRKLAMPRWINDYLKWEIDSLFPHQSPNTVFSNNNSIDPGFNSTIVDQGFKLAAYVRKIATQKLDSTWFFNPTGALYPPTWPLPENLAYSNTAMQSAGTDGFALGDLNWFPTQKAHWLTDVKVDKGAKVPTTFSLSNAYPNPFNPTTNIDFNIAKSGTVKLIVYNVLGQQVKTLINKEMKAGSFTVTWDGRNDFGAQVVSGVYFYRLESQSFSVTKKMILLK